MKTNLEKFSEVSALVKSNETYDIYDLPMEHLIVSMTRLHAGKETRGHTHPGQQEEVYICMEGSGKLQIKDSEQLFGKYDIATIPIGAFHKVINNSKKDLVFLCVFEKYNRA